MINLDFLLTYCPKCVIIHILKNDASLGCICPKTKTLQTKVIDRISTQKVKGKKVITKIYGLIEPADLKNLKKYLATGGRIIEDYFEIRGKPTKKLKDFLTDLNYEFSESALKVFEK